MSLFTRDKVILSADRRSYIQYDPGTGRMNCVVGAVTAWYASTTALVFALAASFTGGIGASGGFTASRGAATPAAFQQRRLPTATTPRRRSPRPTSPRCSCRAT